DPLRIQGSAVLPVEIDRRLIPFQHLPHHAGAIFFERLLHGPAEKLFPRSFAPFRLRDDDILQVEAFAFPGGVSPIVQGESDNPAPALRDKEAIEGLCTKPIRFKTLDRIGHFMCGAFVGCQLPDQFEDAWQIFLFALTDGDRFQGDIGYISSRPSGGTTPMLYQVNAYWSAIPSSAFLRLEEPWPDLVSMRIRTGLSPA